MNKLAIASVAGLLALAIAGAQAQSGQPAGDAQAASSTAGPADAKPASAAAAGTKRSRLARHQMDLRYCLDRGSNEAIAKCAEVGR